MKRFLTAKGLSIKELQEIRELEKECSRYEALYMKLSWDMLENRSRNTADDFLYYDDSLLIGFLGMYGMSEKAKEIEITGMVHPDYRRKGIFSELFNAARLECKNRGIGRILLITERSSDAGTDFAKSTGARYAFSEYRMKFSKAAALDSTFGIKLRKAESKDFQELVRLDALSFGIAGEELENNNLESHYASTYAAELEGKFIGKIGTLMDGEDGYIFGFVIKPEYRGRGYGREVLCLALEKLVSDQVSSVLLEVAVNNEKALLLYKSCGFETITVYDYYEIQP